MGVVGLVGCAGVAVAPDLAGNGDAVESQAQGCLCDRQPQVAQALDVVTFALAQMGVVHGALGLTGRSHKSSSLTRLGLPFGNVHFVV